jgi:hypothetical protein
MHADRRFALGVLVAVAIAAGVLGFSRDVRSAHAQAAGDFLVILVPAGTGVVTTGPTGDKVIFIGKSAGNVDARGCVPATDTTLRPSQTAVFVDPGAGQRASKLSGVITLSVNGTARADDIPNGTRVGNLVAAGNCAIGTDSYDKFVGTVE